MNLRAHGLCVLAEQEPHPLPLRNPFRPFGRALLGPLRDLPEPDLVLDGIPVDRYDEFRHRAGLLGINVVFAELRHGNRNGFVQALGIDIDAVQDAVRIGEGHTVATRFSLPWTAGDLSRWIG